MSLIFQCWSVNYIRTVQGHHSNMWARVCVWVIERDYSAKKKKKKKRRWRGIKLSVVFQVWETESQILCLPFYCPLPNLTFMWAIYFDSQIWFVFHGGLVLYEYSTVYIIPYAPKKKNFVKFGLFCTINFDNIIIITSTKKKKF